MFFQKIDSAGRGPIAASILTATSVLQPDVILFAPAFPALHRRVHQGWLQVRDIAGQDASIQLRSLFPHDAQPRIAEIPTGSSEYLQAEMLAAHQRGRTLWLCDSHTDQDLRALVQTALRLSLRILWAGSGGLASALASEMHAPKSPSPSPPKPQANASLVICGTPHPVTHLQLQSLRSRRNTPVLEVNWSTTSSMEIRETFLRTHPEALILTGGDTAAFILRALECDSVLIGGEIAPGIPWGRISGGLADGCYIVTKSGGFGDEMSLITAIDFCTQDNL